MPRLLVLLPCYNEERALPPLLERLHRVRAQLQPQWELSVLVVDDGSTDGSARAALAGPSGLPATLVSHERNLGLGRALGTGIEIALQQLSDADVLAVMDADMTHPPELLPQMLAELAAEDRADMGVVIASRYAPGGAEHGLPLRRRILSRLASVVLAKLARVPGVRDYTCGYRVYRIGPLRRVNEQYDGKLVIECGFVCMAELLVKLARQGVGVAEVPLDLHYELKGGLSKMDVAATIRRYAVLGWKLLFDHRLRRGGGRP
jgi:dolichol-phosphate mannosyltransferase